MIVDYFVLAIMLLALCQSKKRRAAALVFAGINLYHGLCMAGFSDHRYFISGAFLAMLIIGVTANLPTVSKLTIDIQRICIADIIINAAGWVMYEFYLDPFIYNMAFTLLYSWAIVVLLKDEGLRYGAYRLDNWASYFRFDNLQSPSISPKYKGAVKS